MLATYGVSRKNQHKVMKVNSGLVILSRNIEIAVQESKGYINFFSFLIKEKHKKIIIIIIIYERKSCLPISKITKYFYACNLPLSTFYFILF